jgi:alanyl-tRNA synthetase
MEEKKQQQKKLSKQNLEKHITYLKTVIDSAEKINGSVILAEKLDIESSDEFKEIGEDLRKVMKNGVALIASVIDDKISLVCAVSDNLIKEKGLAAGKLISEVAKQLGGGGGGRPQLATAGAKDVAALDKALADFSVGMKSKLS